mmetsp:Transcript_5802/g.36018  ORF Transcript_5802/g.36018 Transcript_5802/m.36018 type:complete len:104 (-) Transcript_5802:1035-1346(-)
MEGAVGSEGQEMQITTAIATRTGSMDEHFVACNANWKRWNAVAVCGVPTMEQHAVQGMWFGRMEMGTRIVKLAEANASLILQAGALDTHSLDIVAFGCVKEGA